MLYIDTRHPKFHIFLIPKVVLKLNILVNPFTSSWLYTQFVWSMPTSREDMHFTLWLMVNEFTVSVVPSFVINTHLFIIYSVCLIYGQDFKKNTSILRCLLQNYHLFLVAGAMKFTNFYLFTPIDLVNIGSVVLEKNMLTDDERRMTTYANSMTYQY